MHEVTRRYLGKEDKESKGSQGSGGTLEWKGRPEVVRERSEASMVVE